MSNKENFEHENYNPAIDQINHVILVNGLGSPIKFGSSFSLDAPKLLKAILLLIEQRQRDRLLSEELELNLRRLQNELDFSTSTQSKLKQKHEASERELETFRQKYLLLEKNHACLQNDFQATKDEMQRVKKMVKHKETQFQHEIRKREKDYEKLRTQLQKSMSSSLRDQKASIELVNPLKPDRISQKQSILAEDVEKMLIRKYEDREKQLQQEIGLLKDTLFSVKTQLQQVILNDNNPDVLHQAKRAISYNWVSSSIQEELSSSISQLVQQTVCLQSEIARLNGAAVSQDELENNKKNIKDLKKIIHEQEKIIQMSLSSNDLQRRLSQVDIADNSNHSHALEKERESLQQKVQQLEKDRKAFMESAIQLAQERETVLAEKNALADARRSFELEKVMTAIPGTPDWLKKYNNKPTSLLTESTQKLLRDHATNLSTTTLEMSSPLKGRAAALLRAATTPRSHPIPNSFSSPS